MGIKTRTEEEYEKAEEIIKILIKEGVIPEYGGIGDRHLDAWNAAFDILDLFKTKST